MIAAIEVNLKVEDTLIDTDELRRYYAGGMNAINYVVTILEGQKYQSEEVQLQAINEALNNLLTATIEHPIANAIGEYTYSLDWATDGFGNGRLKSEFGYLDETIEAGALDKSGQVPEFEKQRNSKNLDFLHKLTEGRQVYSQDIYVEFSPTPSVPKKVREQRGYRNNDTMLIYRLDKDGREIITQHWFPMVAMEDWRNLLVGELQSKEVALHKDQLSDLDIMSASGKFGEDGIEKIMEFLSVRRYALDDNKSHIENYLVGLKGRLSLEARELLLAAAYDASIGYDITKHLSLIEDIITRYQLELTLFINGIDGNNSKYGGMSNTGFSQMTYEEQMAKIKELDFIAAGCGFGDSGEEFGTFTSIMAQIDGDKYGSLRFKCPVCGHSNLRNHGELLNACQNPGCDATSTQLGGDNCHIPSYRVSEEEVSQES